MARSGQRDYGGLASAGVAATSERCEPLGSPMLTTWPSVRSFVCYEHIPNRPPERLRPLLDQFAAMLVEHRLYKRMFAILKKKV